MLRRRDRLLQQTQVFDGKRILLLYKLLLLISLVVIAFLLALLSTQRQHPPLANNIAILLSSTPPASPATVIAAVATARSNASAAVPDGAAVVWDTGGPFSFPKFIHQTVANKTRLSCQQRKVIDSWKKLNPGYEHLLWDDKEMRDFVQAHYPDLVPMPYDEFLNAAERTDLWRVLVLHKFGGVYADMDVQCLQPIDKWNSEHNHDAALLLGIENYDHKRPEPLHVVNWVLASMPNHPLLALLPKVVATTTQQQFYDAARKRAKLDEAVYEGGILDRTGPAALTRAMYQFYKMAGRNTNSITYDNVTSAEGVVAGGARLLPIDRFASGWEVAEARRKRERVTCEDLGQRVQTALVCHMFWGSWRATWGFQQQHTFTDNC